MLDLDILKRRGCSTESIRETFEAYDLDAPLPMTAEDTQKDKHNKLCSLRNRIRTRIQAGRDWNFANYKTFHALDLAWGVPFRQMNPTLLMSLMNEQDERTIENKLQSWGISINDVVETVTDPKSGKPVKRLNAPAFFRVFVPLVRAYVTIRWAKIINDRRMIPFFKYEPSFTSKKNRIRCEVLSNRIEIMSRQYGYFEVMKQACFQMLHYGVCLQFPTEEWHTETQLSDGAPGEKDSKEGEVITKEGIRYHMPHPARMFWDQAHRLSTFNTDPGCE
jgi:hypothetical protein